MKTRPGAKSSALCSSVVSAEQFAASRSRPPTTAITPSSPSPAQTNQATTSAPTNNENTPKQSPRSRQRRVCLHSSSRVGHFLIRQSYCSLQPTKYDKSTNIDHKEESSSIPDDALSKASSQPETTPLSVRCRTSHAHAQCCIQLSALRRFRHLYSKQHCLLVVLVIRRTSLSDWGRQAAQLLQSQYVSICPFGNDFDSLHPFIGNFLISA